MFIKEVILEGFKSYKDHTIVEFAPGANVVCGKNGSGKSNVFDAIQFVVSDKYWNIRREIRQKILHEGASSGSADVAVGYVEVVFDNVDNRFPLDTPEVRLRRVIALKKDEYLLNDKQCSKSDVDSLLEAAGFSRSNPYNIVQQGKVARLIKMKPAERLDLCKEVAGTRVYDDRRKESLKILKDAQSRRDRIQEIVAELEENLQTLEQDKEELDRFQDLDRERRSIEYTLYDKELHNVTEELQRIEDTRAETSETSEKLYEMLSDSQDTLMRLNGDMEDVIRKLERCSKEYDRLREVQREEEVERTRLEYAVADTAEKRAEESNKGESRSQEVDELEAQIKDAMEERDGIQPKLDQLKHRESELSQKRTFTLQRINDLYSKMGRKTKFKSKKDRDISLKKEIESLQAQLQEQSSQLNEAQTRRAMLEEKRQDAQGSTEQKEVTMKELRNKWKSLGHEEQSLIDQRDISIDKRKDLWKRASDQQHDLSQARESLASAKRSLYQSLHRDMRSGLEAVQTLIAEGTIDGIFGTIVDLVHHYSGFEKFHKCIETTAGTRLFHVIVRDDDVATKVLMHLQKNDLGRVTLVPLNRIQEEAVEYPDTTDAFPLIDRLQFDDEVRPAFHQIFGKTLVTRDIHVASQLASKYRLNTITLDGDQVNHRGAFSGGWIDSRTSRLFASQKVKALEKAVADATENGASLTEQNDVVDQQVTLVLGRLQKVKNERTTLKLHLDNIMEEISVLSKASQPLDRSIEAIDKGIRDQETNMTVTRQSISNLEQEIGTALQKKLSAAEEAELENLNSSLSSWDKELISISKEKSSIEVLCQTLTAKVQDTLQPRLDALRRSFMSISAQELEESFEKTSKSLAFSEKRLAKQEQVLQSLESKLDDLSNAKQTVQTMIDEAKAEEEVLRAKLRGDSKSLNKLLNSKSLLSQKKEKCVRNIRDLGSLPSDAFHKFKKKGTKTLLKMLEKLGHKLKKFKNVNRKASDQFLSSKERHAALQSKIGEVDVGEQAIESLIEHLDHRKEDAIRRTFRAIARNFASVFSELVPDGSAELLLDMVSNQEGDQPMQVTLRDLEDMDEPEGSFRFTGIDIRVTFAGSRDVCSMQQLSGGQQTIVALSLIFAIQRCDPSPFYLFDEIDSNLDAVYRTSVANVIRAQAHDTQFISTTFRHEMLASADRCFGVSYENKVSRINPITSDMAAEIISEVENDVEGFSSY